MTTEDRIARCVSYLEHCEGPLTAFVLISRATDAASKDFGAIPEVVADALYIALRRNGYLSPLGEAETLEEQGAVMVGELYAQ